MKQAEWIQPGGLAEWLLACIASMVYAGVYPNVPRKMTAEDFFFGSPPVRPEH